MRAFQLGANDYLAKPFRREQLVRKVVCQLAPGYA